MQGTEVGTEHADVVQRIDFDLLELADVLVNIDIDIGVGAELGERATAFTKEISRPRKRFGRNSPCPCGSGQKYKKCCLRARNAS